jgi:hypothetical protein
LGNMSCGRARKNTCQCWGQLWDMPGASWLTAAATTTHCRPALRLHWAGARHQPVLLLAGNHPHRPHTHRICAPGVAHAVCPLPGLSDAPVTHAVAAGHKAAPAAAQALRRAHGPAHTHTDPGLTARTQSALCGAVLPPMWPHHCDFTPTKLTRWAALSC